MTWTWALLIASATGFTAFGFLLHALLTWPKRRVPEHPQMVFVTASNTNSGADGAYFRLTDPPEPPPRHLTLVPPPAQFVDAQALGWLEGA